MLVGYAVMLILYMAIVLYGVNVMRSVVQEKTTRVIELLVAVARPRALMLGKIFGVGAVGLVQIGVWLAMAVLTLQFREQLLGALGVGGAGGVSVPPLRAAEIALVLGYFVAGYFFYASIFAALGAMVSSEQEAQQAATPVSLLLIVPLVCVSLITADPRGEAAQWLTMIPLSAPLLMPMRYLLGGASGAEVALSMGLLVLSTGLVVVLAARIYRVGILMYGKRPTLRELLRWMRRG
jgi:ABC-2 type transport system permease protein